MGLNFFIFIENEYRTMQFKNCGEVFKFWIVCCPALQNLLIQLYYRLKHYIQV